MAKKHKPHDEEHIDETWLIPYADLLTLLLALFIVLFASSQIDAKKFDQLSRSFNSALSGGISFFDNATIAPTEGDDLKTDKDDANDDLENSVTAGDKRNNDEKQREKSTEQEQKDLEELKRRFDQYIQQNGLTTQLRTNLNHQQLKLTISDNTLFDSGSAEVKSEARDLAVAIAAMLQQYPDYNIIVAGHTDNQPINTAAFPSNWHLSTARALNFMNYLIQDDSIVPERFRVVGYGEYQPVATNETQDGRAANRRVEVTVTSEETDIATEEDSEIPSGENGEARQ